MHAPDGFYSIPICLAADAVCLGILGYCIKKVWGKLNRKTLTLAASVGALVFAIEMANVTVAKGSSCHCMGGIFAAIVLGPYLATIVVTIMHLVQFFIFQDGGLMALGANTLTIAVMSTFFGYYLYHQLKSWISGVYGIYISAFLSTWLTLLITALTVCFMLAVSGVEQFHFLIGPMVGPHVLIGVLEGIMTMGLLFLMNRNAPGIIYSFPEKNQMPAYFSQTQRWGKNWYYLLALALIVSMFVSPFASRHLDGLEKLSLSFEARGHSIVEYYHAPLAECVIPGITNERIANGGAGLIGVLLTFGFSWTAGLIFVGKKEEITEERYLEERC